MEAALRLEPSNKPSATERRACITRLLREQVGGGSRTWELSPYVSAQAS